MERREEIEKELREHGKNRQDALTTAEQELDEIAALIPAALDAGITKSEINRLTGISRVTIDEVIRRGR